MRGVTRVQGTLVWGPFVRIRTDVQVKSCIALCLVGLGGYVRLCLVVHGRLYQTRAILLGGGSLQLIGVSSQIIKFRPDELPWMAFPQNAHKDGHPPSKTYQKEVYYRLEIWHMDLTHKIKTMLSAIDGQPPSPGGSPTIPRKVTHNPKST